MRIISFLKPYIYKAAQFWAALLLFVLVIQCEDDRAADLGELNRNFADRTTIDAVLNFKDSGRIIMDLKAPLIEEFTLIDSPYTIMKKGVLIEYQDLDDPKPSFLRSDWAKKEDKKKLYEGKGNVQLINYDNDTLFTEHIFWDNQNRRIFTEDTVIIKRVDGTINISNNGLDASEDFKTFTLYNNHGTYILNNSTDQSDGLVQKPKKKRTLDVSKDTITPVVPLPIEN